MEAETWNSREHRAHSNWLLHVITRIVASSYTLLSLFFMDQSGFDPTDSNPSCCMWLDFIGKKLLDLESASMWSDFCKRPETSCSLHSFVLSWSPTHEVLYCKTMSRSAYVQAWPQGSSDQYSFVFWDAYDTKKGLGLSTRARTQQTRLQWSHLEKL